MELSKTILKNYFTTEQKLQCKIIIGTILRIINCSLKFKLQDFSLSTIHCKLKLTEKFSAKKIPCKFYSHFSVLTPKIQNN